jgi:thiamine transport system ATP-binding protein
MNAPDDNAVEIEELVYRYEAMEMRFSLTVAAGAFVILFGPSGAGKSTLLNLIAGFEAPLSGTLRLLGRDVLGAPPAARPVTTLFQDHNLFPHLTAAQNVALGLHPGRLDTAETARVAEALAHVGLAGLEARRPAQLSGGERQRVALARSLVRDRPILLLDEPFAALGPAQRREMVALVDRLRQERGLTVLMVSHQLDALPGIAAQAAFVADGRIAATGPATELLTRPPLPEIADYLGSAVTLQATGG